MRKNSECNQQANRSPFDSLATNFPYKVRGTFVQQLTENTTTKSATQQTKVAEAADLATKRQRRWRRRLLAAPPLSPALQ